MDHNDLELARLIGQNASDIPGTIERLCDEVSGLEEELAKMKLEPGADYHNFAMRTAAGPEVYYRDLVRSVGGQDSIREAMGNFIHAARVLSAMKATLFYGKDYEFPSINEAHDLVDEEFHTDNFDNYQLLHAILGITSESGELLEDVVRLILLPDPDDCDVDDLPKRAEEEKQIRANMLREQGDIDWFQELFALATGRTVDEARIHNIGRLRLRFPDKFSTTDAIARADEVPYVEEVVPALHPGAELGMPAPEPEQ